MSYRGNYAAASTVVFNFNTASFTDGSPITLAGTPALSVYKNSTTESTAGVTLTVDYDARTGMHHAVIDTSADGTFYAAGNDFDVVITTGTVGGTSVVGRVVGSFSLMNRASVLSGAQSIPSLTLSGAFTVNGGVTYTNASGNGFTCSSSGGNGDGIHSAGNGTGYGIHALGQNGVQAESSAVNGSGFNCTGTGTGDGFASTGGATGRGIHALGGSSSGAGIRCEALAGNSNGFELIAIGTGDGINSTGGATGRGGSFIGGSSSGAGFRCVGSAGNANGFEALGQGTGDGMHATGGATGDGFESVGGSTSGDGFKGTVTSGAPFRGDQIGNMTGNITGNLSGSVGSVTTVSAGAITSTSFAAGAIDNAAIAPDAIGSSELAATAVAEIAAGVWDLATAGHTTSGTFGAAMAAAGAAGDPWSTSLPAAYGAGTAGFIVGTNLDALISSRTKPADTQAAVTLVTTTTNLTNAPTAGDLTTAMKASVKLQMTDALAVDTYAELVSVPSATSTLKDKLNWIFSLMRNKRTQTATLETLRNDTDGANIATSTKGDDGTTLTRGEWS